MGLRSSAQKTVCGSQNMCLRNTLNFPRPSVFSAPIITVNFLYGRRACTLELTEANV
jgi:hypothetical protein